MTKAVSGVFCCGHCRTVVGSVGTVTVSDPGQEQSLALVIPTAAAAERPAKRRRAAAVVCVCGVCGKTSEDWVTLSFRASIVMTSSMRVPCFSS